jgi:hypothetical protein
MTSEEARILLDKLHQAALKAQRAVETANSDGTPAEQARDFISHVRGANWQDTHLELIERLKGYLDNEPVEALDLYDALVLVSREPLVSNLYSMYWGDLPDPQKTFGSFAGGQ